MIDSINYKKLNKEELRLHDSFPFVITFQDADLDGFFDWYRSVKDKLDFQLENIGAVLLRGLPIRSDENFHHVVSKISSDFLDYVDGNSPRTKLSSGVYTSTEFDKDFEITLHNELSYSNSYPSKLYFCCIVPAAEGGETPIAQGEKVYQAMDPEILENMERRGICYIRNLHDGTGISGPSWQDTFETTDRGKVSEFCESNNIEFEWNADFSRLKLKQLGPCSIATGEDNKTVWFNQADQFHPAHFPEEILEPLLMLYDDDISQLPTYATFGDGGEIPIDWIHKIKATVDANVVANLWEPGDLLMLNNKKVMHGRRPFKGDRRILVSME